MAVAAFDAYVNLLRLAEPIALERVPASDRTMMLKLDQGPKTAIRRT